MILCSHKYFIAEDEVRDAVLVTDGDGEMGQVSLAFLFPQLQPLLD